MEKEIIVQRHIIDISTKILVQRQIRDKKDKRDKNGLALVN